MHHLEAFRHGVVCRLTNTASGLTAELPDHGGDVWQAGRRLVGRGARTQRVENALPESRIGRIGENSTISVDSPSSAPVSETAMWKAGPHAQPIVQVGILQPFRSAQRSANASLKMRGCASSPEMSEDSSATPVMPTRNIPHVRASGDACVARPGIPPMAPEGVTSPPSASASQLPSTPFSWS